MGFFYWTAAMAGSEERPGQAMSSADFTDGCSFVV